MTYAPILDPASYTSDAEPRRRLALAAAGLLQKLASDLQTFREAVDAMESCRPPSALPIERIRQLLIAHHLLAEDSGSDDPVLVQLLEQLEQVRAFGELDGRALDDYIQPIARMIRSGRVELFAGKSARSSRSLSR